MGDPGGARAKCFIAEIIGEVGEGEVPNEEMRRCLLNFFMKRTEQGKGVLREIAQEEEEVKK